MPFRVFGLAYISQPSGLNVETVEEVVVRKLPTFLVIKELDNFDFSVIWLLKA